MSGLSQKLWNCQRNLDNYSNIILRIWLWLDSDSVAERCCPCVYYLATLTLTTSCKFYLWYFWPKRHPTVPVYQPVAASWKSTEMRTRSRCAFCQLFWNNGTSEWQLQYQNPLTLSEVLINSASTVNPLIFSVCTLQISGLVLSRGGTLEKFGFFWKFFPQ